MGLKYKLLAVVSTFALSIWGYNDFIDNSATEKALLDQVDLLTENEVAAVDSTMGVIVASPEDTGKNITRPQKFATRDIIPKKATLIPQGPAFSGSTTAKKLPHTSLIVPQKTEQITREEAVYAAIDGSEESLKILQHYFDSSAGQSDKITKLASEVLSKLGNSALANNNHSLQDAAARVIDAAARAATSAYTIPYSSISDFGLSFGDLGWDFGPAKKIPHRGFIRITPASGNIEGTGLLALEASKENDFLKDGIINVSAFGIPEMEEGSFRLFVFTAPLPSGVSVSQPFGDRFGVNGNQLRVIDTAKTGSPQWAKLSSNGVSLTGEEGNKEFASATEPIKLGFEQKNDINGWLLTTLVKSGGEPINMRFESDSKLETYIVGIIMSPVDMTEMEELLNEQLFAMLENLAPGGYDTAGRTFNNDFTANIFSQFFNNPNLRSALGPNAQNLDGFGSRISLPSGNPPADDPPADDPPADDPPADDPPADDPPADDPPADDPPADDPPADDPPADDPPADDPPADDPPADDPPADDPPADDPPADSIQLFADAGPDQTIYLGMDFNLDGCAPNPFSISTISLCDIENEIGSLVFDELFDISWELQLDGDTTVSLGNDLQLFNVIANNGGLFPLGTTNFPGLGSYIIELVIDYSGNAFEYNNITVTNNGVALSAADQMTLFIVNISAPPMLALFGLGFAFTVYRRRKNPK